MRLWSSASPLGEVTSPRFFNCAGRNLLPVFDLAGRSGSGYTSGTSWEIYIFPRKWWADFLGNIYIFQEVAQWYTVWDIYH